jgi:hypothetical protein
VTSCSTAVSSLLLSTSRGAFSYGSFGREEDKDDDEPCIFLLDGFSGLSILSSFPFITVVAALAVVVVVV